MAYDPLYLGSTLYAGSKGAGQIYILDTVDDIATIAVPGYISDGHNHGMQIGDPVFVRCFNSLPAKGILIAAGWYTISAISFLGAVTLVSSGGTVVIPPGSGGVPDGALLADDGVTVFTADDGTTILLAD